MRSRMQTPMAPFPILRSLFASTAALVLSVASATAGMAGIEDRGEFFSESAKATAGRQIADLQGRLKKDFTIETWKAIPVEAGAAPNASDKAAVGRFMEQWAEKQAREKRVNGVFALLVKSPPHLQVVVGNDTQKKAFTLRDRDQLVSVMLGKLRAKDYDAALLDGVSFVSSTMRAHASSVPGALATGESASNGFNVERPQGAAREKNSWGWLVPLLVVGLGVWLVMALFRALRGGGSSTAPGMSGQGGGFMSSLMGGLFGAAAGMWMYNQFFGGSSSAFGADPAQHGQDGGPAGFSGEDTDYSGTGDSFGGDSSGGDSGGDSGGGGDF